MTTTQLKRELRERGAAIPDGAATDELRVLLEKSRATAADKAREEFAVL